LLVQEPAQVYFALKLPLRQMFLYFASETASDSKLEQPRLFLVRLANFPDNGVACAPNAR
jgi:hypothetical protein